ncbi:MAG TPA: DUF2169 domain-containing protein [Polyangiales bacterium]|nr:DUF2169 domain-containing protein [Polyangiales bacterium]
MWALRNETPYGAERSWVRDRDGSHVWVVAVRAWFDLDAAGALRLADEQPPPAHSAEYFAKPGASSLRGDAELGLGKPGTDVIVNASAYAPRGRAAASVPIGLRAGALRKLLLVHGERVYVSRGDGLETSAARPFVMRPLRYELAFGGSDTSSADAREHVCDPRNPIGRGVVSARRRRTDQLAHVVEYPGQDARRAGPAGFGAIDRAWLPRRSHAGTYDVRWERDKKPFLPDDYDSRFAHAAPADQQLHEPLRGGEPLELTNLTPEGTLHFLLPSLRFSFETAFGARIVQHEATLATVRIDADERKLAMTFHTQLPVSGRECDYLDQTVVRERVAP